MTRNSTLSASASRTALLLAALLGATPGTYARAVSLTLEHESADGTVTALDDGTRTGIPAQVGTLRVRSSTPVARMRLIGSGDTCPFGRLADVSNGDDPSTADDDGAHAGLVTATFDTTVPAGSGCTLTVHAWAENYRWVALGTAAFTSVASESVPRHDITRGTRGRSPMTTLDSTVTLDNHGVRVYCTASHLSHDDPIVHPRRPGAAHLHLFWGNTGTDAFTTADSLAERGRASCEGGRNNRSAYWAPALFDAEGQAVLPESIFVYYKSHGSAAFDRNTIQPIPEGLQMLATRGDAVRPGVGNASDAAFTVYRSGAGGTTLDVRFPPCLQVDDGGVPLLSSEDDVSHTAYAFGGGSANDCPASHPYRIPQVSYTIAYDVPFGSDWRLASDHHGLPKGRSLHADYFASWDVATMNAIVTCNRMAWRACRFRERLGDGRVRLDDQLPERLQAPDGSPVYRYSTVLLPGTDRTPFGATLGPRHR